MHARGKGTPSAQRDGKMKQPLTAWDRLVTKMYFLTLDVELESGSRGSR